VKILYYLLIIGLLIICPIALFGQINNPILFTADETDSLMNAEFRFIPLPEYGKESILQIKLSAISNSLNNRAMRMNVYNTKSPKLKEVGKRTDILHTDNSIEWIMTAGPESYIHLPDTINAWKPIIKAGDSLVFDILSLFKGVGEFSFILSDIGNSKDQIKLQFVVVLDEDGKAVYIGKYPPPYLNPLEAHVYCFGDNIETALEGKEIFRRNLAIGVLEPFDIVLNIEPTPRVGITSEVHFSISAMSAGIKDIQYEIMHARKLKIDTISASQGDNPGKDERFETSFKMTPVMPGRAFLSFEVFGFYKGGRHGDMTRSKVSYNLIFDSDSSLLYMGKVDPFEAGFKTGNPAYQKINNISEFKDAKIGFKTQRSIPDFQYDRKNEERISDSLQKIEQDKKN
jgi:hypothetical protein